MPPIEIKLKRHLSAEFCSDILITAFDGSYGSSWYWASSARGLDGDRKVIEVTRHEDGRENLWKHVLVYDNLGQQEEPPPLLTADHEAVGRGIQMILDNKITNTVIRDAVSRAVLEMDAGDIDAEAADCIIQAGLLGSIVYG